MKDRYVCGALTAALWAAVVGVAAWWAAGGGPAEMGTWTGWTTSTGRLSGLLASVLLLAQGFMIARIPLVEKTFGQEGRAGAQRLLGIASVSLMGAHIVLIAIGYAGGSLVGSLAEFVDLVRTHPAILLALAGAVAVLAGAITSAKALRRRFPDESQHLLQLYAFLGGGLALPHQLWTGQEFLDSPLITAMWWAVWGATAFAVILWRIVIPTWRTMRHGVRGFRLA